MPIQTMRIDVLGTSFTIQTDESREYMDKVVTRLRERIEAVRRDTKVVDPLKSAILAGIFLVDELERGAPRPLDPAAEELERIASTLIARIDEGLDDDNRYEPPRR